MSATKRWIYPAIATAALSAAAVQADTRSADAVPKKGNATATAAAKAQGPKQGFPDNAGLARAREVANENARFLRPDSAG